MSNSFSDAVFAAGPAKAGSGEKLRGPQARPAAEAAGHQLPNGQPCAGSAPRITHILVAR